MYYTDFMLIKSVEYSQWYNYKSELEKNEYFISS